MARVNQAANRPTIHTHEGAPAKRIDAEAQLRRTLMACLLWERSFYEDGKGVADRLREGVAAVPLEAAGRLAIEAREQMHLRHAPLLVVREMARHKGAVIGDTLARVIQRADELSEFLALYWQDGKVPLSAQVKRGLAEAFPKFDEYQLAKYDRATDVRLRDVLFLTHPKPKDLEQAALWKRLANNELETPDTWEVALSGGGDKRGQWTRLLAEKRLGGLALLRNLRNMREAGVDDALIRQGITEGNYRRVLPFRFIAAARHAPDFEPELEEAMLGALADAPKLPGKTALVVDHSGSMVAKLSARSDMTRFEAACGLAILLREVAEQVDVIAFSAPGAHGHYGLHGYVGGMRVDIHPERPHLAVVPPRRGFALRDALDQATCWWGTNTDDAKKLADSRGYDRIIVVTDEQSHQKLSDPLPKTPAYVVNVSSERNGIGYGRWTHIDGWSEAVVRYIQAAEGVGEIAR